MSRTNIKNKSDYKIANVTISPQQQQQVSGSHKDTNNYCRNTDSDMKTRTDKNNNNNNDNNNTLLRDMNSD